jgi:hypothetical protein
MTTRRLILTFGVVLIPTLAFTLHDLVLQLPDNQHEASPGFFLTVLGLLLVWAVGGYLAASGTRTVGMGIASGVVSAIMSVGMLGATFILLNNTFTDRMSYEPDRIRAFRASGYSTIREYVNHGMGLGPLPLLMTVAVVAAAAGSIFWERASRTKSNIGLRPTTANGPRSRRR